MMTFSLKTHSLYYRLHQHHILHNTILQSMHQYYHINWDTFGNMRTTILMHSTIWLSLEDVWSLSSLWTNSNSLQYLLHLSHYLSSYWLKLRSWSPIPTSRIQYTVTWPTLHLSDTTSSPLCQWAISLIQYVQCRGYPPDDPTMCTT
jgi:hypothetical protein